MYGDVYVNEEEGSIDVSIELGNGKFYKVFTDPHGAYTHSVLSNPFSSNKVWSKK